MDVRIQYLFLNKAEKTMSTYKQNYSHNFELFIDIDQYLDLLL